MGRFSQQINKTQSFELRVNDYAVMGCVLRAENAQKCLCSQGSVQTTLGKLTVGKERNGEGRDGRKGRGGVGTTWRKFATRRWGGMDAPGAKSTG